MVFNGLRDPHLNVFYAYGDKSHLENNITKAFVNVLESFDNKQLKAIVKELFEFELEDGVYDTSFFLQRKPSEEFVSKYPNRIMFAFSPTGKSWGIEGLDTKNEKEIRRILLEEAKKRFDSDEEQNEFVDYSVNEIMKEREKQGSIPDGWLFIDVNGKPTLVVAMENKLYDLNPYQLNNHIEKSLLIKENKPDPVYKKYDDILVSFKSINTYLCNQFAEYLIILNYTKVDDFSVACLSYKEIRQRLAMNFGKDILDLVHDGEKDTRNRETVRCHVDYEYLREINLRFNDDRIRLLLSFGPTQNTAKVMLSRIDKIQINDSRFESFHEGFHLIYQRGRIIGDLYVEDWTIDEYINYWKSNIDYVKTSTPEETIALYEKMYNDGKIDRDFLEYTKARLFGKKNKILIVPEITFAYAWTYEEASKLGIEGLANEIKERLSLSLKEMKLL